MKATRVETELSNEEYRDVLTDIYGDIKVGNLTFEAGRIVEELDPVAFRCGKSDYESSLDEDSPKWSCSHCGEVYDEEDGANECCLPVAVES